MAALTKKVTQWPEPPEGMETRTEPVWWDLLLGTLLASEVHRGGQPKRRTPPSPDPKPSRPSIPTGSPSDPNRTGTPSVQGRVEGRQEDRDQQADQKDPQRQPGCCLWLKQAPWVGPQQAGGAPGGPSLWLPWAQPLGDSSTSLLLLE